MANGKQYSVKPDPDPTVLTTQALFREIDGLRLECRDRATALRELLETRLNGSDKAVELLQASSNKFPSFVKSEVCQLQELHGEKFDSIETQFKERDTRTEQTSRDSKIAIDAALQAAKEAVGKTEVSFTKQIDAIGITIQILGKGIDDKITDIKDRLTSIESYAKGAGGLWGYIVGAIGLVTSVVMAVMFVISKT